MIQHIGDIRDLLASVIGEDLERARLSGLLVERYPDHGHSERLVAWVLDGMTIRSLENLIALRKQQGWTE